MRAAVELECRYAVDHAVGPDLIRAVVEHRHTRLRSGLNYERLPFEASLDHFRHGTGQRRYHRRDDHALNCRHGDLALLE